MYKQNATSLHSFLLFSPIFHQCAMNPVKRMSC